MTRQRFLHLSGQRHTLLMLRLQRLLELLQPLAFITVEQCGQEVFPAAKVGIGQRSVKVLLSLR